MGRASQRISALLEIFQGEDVKTNLSPKPLWRAEIADACSLIVECDRALAGRSCRKESALLSSSQNQLPPPYHLWKPDNLPCKQNGTAHVRPAGPAPRCHKIREILGPSHFRLTSHQRSVKLSHLPGTVLPCAGGGTQLSHVGAEPPCSLNIILSCRWQKSPRVTVGAKVNLVWRAFSSLSRSWLQNLIFH